MKYSITELNILPAISEIKKASQSLAMLDAILMREWEYRYFSFDSKWDSHEMMASMKNGEGDEYFLLFIDNGMAGKIYTTEMKEVSDTQKLLDDIPNTFRSFKNEPAFKMDDMTCCIWKSHSDNSWNASPVLKKIPLMRFIIGREDYYLKWAEEYYEADLSIEMVKAVFDHYPLNERIIRGLNNDISLKDIMDDSKEIGYPI